MSILFMFHEEGDVVEFDNGYELSEVHEFPNHYVFTTDNEQLLISRDCVTPIYGVSAFAASWEDVIEKHYLVIWDGCMYSGDIGGLVIGVTANLDGTVLFKLVDDKVVRAAIGNVTFSNNKSSFYLESKRAVIN